MKWLDKYLQDVRIKKAGKYIEPQSAVLDIGSGKGELFIRNKNINSGIGIEPALEGEIVGKNYKILKGSFPETKLPIREFDVITLLAVLEHIPYNKHNEFALSCFHALKNKGRIIITVPSPKVDFILIFLKKLKLIDGMSLDQHYGFNVKKTEEIFTNANFQMVIHKKFQLALNNLFVFEKK